MNNKELITRLKELLSDKDIIEFHIRYNACFTSEEKNRLLRKTLAAFNTSHTTGITLQPSGTTINQPG